METLDMLIVDDNELVRTGIARLLTGAGYKIAEVDNAKDALKMLVEGGVRPRAIISDYRMPEMEGPEFVKLVRAFPNFRLLPILMVSAEVCQIKKLDAKNAGITAWIAKSAISRELLPAVRAQLAA
jgi:two-component system chemotaxis response regulator CheY